MTFEEEFPSAKQYNRTNWASRDWEKFCLHHMKDEQRVREALDKVRNIAADNPYAQDMRAACVNRLEEELGL